MSILASLHRLHVRIKQYALLRLLVLLLGASFTFSASISVSVSAEAQSWKFWQSSDDQEQKVLEQEQQKQQEELKRKPPNEQAAYHQAAFGEVIYHYFQDDYQGVLKLIEVGRKNHGFTLLSQDNTDRLNLVQGAAQLKLGLYTQSQEKFAKLLGQSTSEYVQANTWYFMAKAGFENKQSHLSEQAYKAIIDQDLRDELSDEQWYELIYLSAYTRMQNGGDWQKLAEQIPRSYIYQSYLQANLATLLFNQADYDNANKAFVKAKESLLYFQNNYGFIGKVAGHIFDSVTFLASPLQWFDGDSNANAEQNLKQKRALQAIDEQNALFDRINIGLGQSLLQQGDLNNAIAVIETIAEYGGETEQALLSYGWANARENRWETAMSAWQHLQENSLGLYSLQASYGLAYAFSQQDNLGQAFYALKDTTEQIEQSIQQLDQFAVQVQSDSFFDDYETQWPSTLNDLRIGFFQPKQDFDAKYLLTIRQQAKAILQDIQNKQSRIDQLNVLLTERSNTYTQRLEDLSLSQAGQQIQQVETYIARLENLIAEATSFEEQLQLTKAMVDEDFKRNMQRLEDAKSRQIRLAQDTTRKRPLKASYLERIERIDGIIKWQLMDDYVAKRWQHQKLLKIAKGSLQEAQKQYQRLQEIGQQKDAFARQREEFAAVKQGLQNQIDAAQSVRFNANYQLTQSLLNIIAARKAQLEDQSVNTRLAMLRIQDLQTQEGR